MARDRVLLLHGIVVGSWSMRRLERAKLPGMADHITLPTTHTTMRWNRCAIEQTIHFLQHGRFKGTKHQ